MSAQVRVNQFDRVVGILRQATLSNDVREKLEFLHQVRELILKFDRSLLDSFFEEVVAFHRCQNANLKLFVVKFIEDACVEDPRLIKKSVVCLSYLFGSCLRSDPPTSAVIRAITDAMKTIYSLSLTRAVKLGIIESGAITGNGIEADSLADISLETLRSVVAFKDEIFRLLIPSSVTAMQSAGTPLHTSALTRYCASLSDGARISIINFIEAVVIQQSRRPPTTDTSSDSMEITLDQIPDLTNNLLRTIIDASTASSSLTPLPGICIVRPRRLADESERLLMGLMKLPLKQGNDVLFSSIVTGPVFEALIDTIVSIARQRPQFFGEAVQSFECIHVNLPPHFSQTQVNLARWKLKSALLCLLQNSTQANAECQSRIVILLTDLGATQQEISSVMPVRSEISARSLQKRNYSISQSSKLSVLGEEDDDEITLPSIGKRSRFGSSSNTPGSSTAIVGASESVETGPSIEEITSCLIPKLTGANVADLVLLSMVNLPTSMPSVFNATYTPIAAAGTNTQVRHLARLLAAQLAVWANDENVTGSPNRALLGQLLGLTDVSIDNKVKKSHRSKRPETIDEDDEDAFMRDHVARVHTSTKPMNISVVQRSSAALTKNTTQSAGVAPARPINLDRKVTLITESQREDLVTAAFKRILAFEPSESSLSDEGHLRIATQSTHLAPLYMNPEEEIHVKILARLIVHAPYSKILYNLFMEHVMSDLKENFEHLMNLLTYEYTHFRGFRLAGSLAETLKSRETMFKAEGDTEDAGEVDDEGDEARRLLLESHRQLMALRAREGDDSVSQTIGVTNSTAFDNNENQQDDGGEIEHSGNIPSSTGDRSFAFYDAIVNDVLQLFVKASVQAPYFGRFLLEAPVLTTRVISFLKNYCAVPEQAEYGFQVVRTLIEMKPTQWREELLNLLFGFSAFEEPTVRDAAIKATCQLANSSAKWEEVVENRAVERMKRILQPKPTSEMFADLFVKPPALTDKWTNETCKLCAQLFLGLLPRNPGKLLSSLAEIYVAASDTVRLFILQHLDTSVCEIGLQSPHFLHLLDNCPVGAESLITRMLRVLTDPRKVAPSTRTEPIMPPQDVVDRMRRLYRERANDVRFIIPVIVGLSKQEVIELLPRILQLSDAYVKEVISRLLRASVATQPPPDPQNPDGLIGFSYKDSVLGPLTPEDLLVAVHLLEFAKDPNANPNDPPPTKPYVEIRVILQACMHCFAERSLYTQERLSAAIGQLLDCPVVPKLFLRTVMQALALYPRLSGYVINVLFRLIQKQVWKTDVLWDGFIRCCVKTQPQSYQVLLQLPPQQFQSVLKREPDLRTQLRRYVDNFSSAQRTHISRGVYEVLEREETPPETLTKKATEEPPQPTSGEMEGTSEVKIEQPDAQSFGAATPVCDEVDEGVEEKVEKIEGRRSSDGEKSATAVD